MKQISRKSGAVGHVQALAHALNCVPDFVLVTDCQGGICFANYACLTHFGYAWEELAGRSPAVLFAAEPAEVAGLFRGDWSGELPATTKPGDHLTVAVENAVIRNAAGQPLGVVSIFRNVTAEKLLQTAQWERETHWRMLSEQMPAVLWTTDTELRFTTSLGGGLSHLQLQPNQVVGLTVEEYCQTTDPAHPILAAHRRALAGESVSAEFQMEGRTYSTHLEPLQGPEGLIVGTVGVALDTTQQRRAERELAHERDLLHALLQNIPDYIYFKDAAGRYTRVNHAHARLLGLAQPGDAVGKTEAEFLHHDANGLGRDDETLLRTGQPQVNKEEHLTAPNGSGHWVSTTKVPLRDRRGVTTGLVGISRDITREKLFEQQLLATQKMATISSLAGGIAHEFNNLLTGILGYAELLAGQVSLDAAAGNYLGQIKRAAVEATELTRELSVFSQMAVIERRTCNLTDLVREALALVTPSADANIRLVNQLPAQSVPCAGDPSQLRQALVNILLNACEAMPVGGVLTVGASSEWLSEDQAGAIGLGAPGRYVCIRVADQGLGMDEALRRRAYEPFFSTKGPTHTGLGLTAAYGILQKHGGALQLDSQAGQGTTVRVYLPESTAIHTQPPGPDSAALPTVLLVEDEEIPRQLAAHVLEAAGYRVLAAHDGEQGLQLYREHGHSINLIVTDIIMPRLSGDEMVAEIRKFNRPVRVLVVSGYTRSDAAERLRSLGVDRLVQKPFTGQVFLDHVRQLLTSRPAE